MSDSLGLSIGMTNLVAARIGRAPVMRRSVLTLFNDRAPEVGVPGENPNLNQPGLVLSGFVERVGDPVPLVAADGSPHRGERVLVEALDAMARTVGGGAPIAIAVPAHWGPATVGALRGALRATPSLAPNGRARGACPGFGRGARRTAGRTGAAVERRRRACATWAAAGPASRWRTPASDFDQIGETVRYADFSGDQIDQALLNHVVAGIAEANNADPAGTLGLGSLARLRDEAQAGQGAAVRRDGGGGARRAARLQLRRQGDPQRAREPHRRAAGRSAQCHRRNVAAQQHSGGQCVRGRDRRRRGEHSAGHPAAVRAAARPRRHHAAVAAQRRGGRRADGRPRTGGDAPTGMAPTGLAAAADAPTGMAAAGWAAGAAGLAASESASDGAASATFRALAWSQDDAPGGEPVPYSGEDYTFDQGPTDARPQVAFAPRGRGLRARAGAAALVQASADSVRGGGRGRAAGHRRPGGHADQHQRQHRSGDRDGDSRRDRARRPGSRRHRHRRRRSR